ncbi:MAG: S1 family peptidase [Myxococcota bacterium]
MRTPPALLALGLLTSASVASAAPSPGPGPGPEEGIEPVEPQVYGGTPAEVCQWPTTVAVTGGGGLCTGALVHPRLVTYAAHCGDGNKQIRFGESSTQALTRQTERCVTNPDYLGTTNQAQDWAFCILAEPMLDIPFTPPAYGCEVDLIQDDTPVVVAGYGDSNVGGSGTKRWGDTVIVSTFGSTAQIGAQGTGVTTCQGDSGGTAYLAMEDGSYRAISMVSTGLPGCEETTGTHALIHPAIPWIEETSQIDITPCHDADGTWNPNPNCTGFFAGGSTPSGVWENMCEGTPASGPAATCGAAFDETPDGDAPEVTVASPTQGEEFESGTLVSIAVDAVDAGYGTQEVWIEIDGMEQPVRDTYPPFVFADVPFPDGVYTIVAHAVDWAGNEGVSAPVTIGVNADVPDAPDPSTGGGDETGGDTGGGDPTSAGEESTSGPSGDESSGGAPPADGGGDGGGCSVTADTPAPAAMLALLGLLGLRRRRASRAVRD